MGGILGHLKVGRGYLLQICCTVHIIAILRIYRRSLINKRGELSEGRRKRNLYETSIAIKSQNGCRGNPTLPCSFSHHLHSRLNKMMHSTLKKKRGNKKLREENGAAARWRSPRSRRRRLRDFHGHCVLWQTVQRWLVLLQILPETGQRKAEEHR